MNFDYGNILTRTFQITWKHKVFWWILTLPMLVAFAMFPFMFVMIFFLEENPQSETNLIFVTVFFVLSALLIVASTVLQIFTLSATSLGIARVERGEGSLKFMDLLQDSREYFWRQFGVFLIIQLSVGLVFTIFFAIVLALSVVTMGMATLCLQPIFILIAPLSFLMIGVLESAHMAVITENLNSWDAVKRGISVVREHIWKYILLTIILYFGISILSSFLMFPMFMPMMALPIMAETDGEITNSMLAIMAGFFCIFFPVMALFSGISQALMKTMLGLTYLRLTQKDENQVIFNDTNKE